MIDARTLGGLTKKAVYTFNSSTTFTTPAAMPSLVAYITATAGGGSGAAPNIFDAHTSGGNSGEYCIRFPVVLAPSTTYTITIGAGGAPNGNDGGDTSFGSLLVLKGGKGGDTVRLGDTAQVILRYQSQRGGKVAQRLIISTATPEILGLTSVEGLNGNKHGENAWNATDQVLATGGAPGLFGNGTNASKSSATTAPDANSGAGSGAVCSPTSSSAAGAAGKLVLEIEEYL